jgi:hypothetical protein
MNRSINKLDVSTVNYIVGQYFMEHLPEAVINAKKFKMTVSRYKNKDIRLIIHSDEITEAILFVADVEVVAAKHN